MRAIQYVAPEVFKTYQKVGYLFENGFFLCGFSYHTAPSYICRKYNFNSPPEVLSWGKGVIDPNSVSIAPGAAADYQFFKKGRTLDVEFDKMKSQMSGRYFWNENHHPSIKLTF